VSDHFPALHGVQLVSALAPREADQLPFPQSVQAPLDVCASWSWYLPAGHCVHAVLAEMEKVPVPQSMHTSPACLFPASHSTQLFPSSTWPGSQTVQVAAPAPLD
jgi:hypothetical protein